MNLFGTRWCSHMLFYSIGGGRVRIVLDCVKVDFRKSWVGFKTTTKEKQQKKHLKFFFFCTNLCFFCILFSLCQFKHAQSTLKNSSKPNEVSVILCWLFSAVFTTIEKNRRKKAQILFVCSLGKKEQTFFFFFFDFHVGVLSGFIYEKRKHGRSCWYYKEIWFFKGEESRLKDPLRLKKKK